jgi:STE24 endopeptidase
VLSVLGTMMIIGLPFSIYRTFKIEARFGFNRITPKLFVADLAKRTALGLVLAGPLLVIAITLMEKAGNAWWLWLWGVWTIATIGLSWAYPRFIAPLFNRFSPLADEALNARIGALLTRCGFSSNGVFVMDGSRRSAHGNAYFTGVGRNKRIVFFDTLMERLGGAEIEAVLAHELGHFRLAHVKQRLVLSMVGSLVGLAILAWFAQQPWFYTALGVPMPSTHAALLLFMLATPAFTYFATPLSAWWSRRHEFQADDFAIVHADRAALADALVKLYRDNASTLTPDPVHSAFYDSHPPALIRIARLRVPA